MKKKKILFLMPSLVGGGAENALIKFLKNFDYQKYEVTLLLVCYHGIYIDKIPKEVNVRYLFKNYKFVSLLAHLQIKFNFRLILEWAFKRTIKEKYDTAISFLDSSFSDLLFLLGSETKKIAWVHSSYISNKNFNQFLRNKKYLNKIIEKRYKRLDCIVFVSNDAKNEFIEAVGSFKNMEVIYNLFDEDELRQKANEGITKNKEFTFVAVGSIIPVKGYDFLIEAAKVLKDSGYNFKINILGQGHKLNEYEASVKTLELENTVSFLGYKSNPYAYINTADVFVMTSLSEALPSALIEAMIIGKPVLITNTAGCREVIEYGKYGMMTERTPEAFAKKMKELIDTPSLKEKYSSLSQEKAKDFSKNNILKRFFEILE